MVDKALLCLRTDDKEVVFEEIKNQFKYFTVFMNDNIITIQNYDSVKCVRITMFFYNNELKGKEFNERKFSIDNQLKSEYRISDKITRNIIIKHAKTRSYIKFQVPGRLDNGIKLKLLALVKRFQGLYIENNEVFFDGDGDVLVDLSNVARSTFDNSKIERDDLYSYRFYSELLAKERGLEVPKGLPLLKVPRERRSDLEICQRIVCILVGAIRADDLSLGKPMEVANSSAKKIIIRYGIRQDWFTKKELNTLVSNSLRRGDMINSLNGYNEALALLFAMGIVESYDFPLLDCNFEDLVQIFSYANDFDELYSRVDFRYDILRYLDDAYVTYNSLIKNRNKGNLDVNIKENVVKSWYKSLKWIYNPNEDWDTINLDN